MRTPTPIDEQLAWHREAIAGVELATHLNEPHCGWFRRRLVKNGPWVPARIWIDEAPVNEVTGELEGDEIMRCQIGDVDRTAQLLDEWAWLCGEPITQEQFDYMVAYIKWARVHEPLSPEAQPHLPVINRLLPEQF